MNSYSGGQSSSQYSSTVSSSTGPNSSNSSNLNSSIQSGPNVSLSTGPAAGPPAPNSNAFTPGQPIQLPDGQTINLPPGVGGPGQNVQINTITIGDTTYVRVVSSIDGGYTVNTWSQPAGAAAVPTITPPIQSAPAAPATSATPTPAAATTAPTASKRCPRDITSGRVSGGGRTTIPCSAGGGAPSKTQTRLTSPQLTSPLPQYNQSQTPVPPSSSDSWFSSTIVCDLLVGLAGLFSPTTVSPYLQPRTANLPPGLEQMGRSKRGHGTAIPSGNQCGHARGYGGGRHAVRHSPWRTRGSRSRGGYPDSVSPSRHASRERPLPPSISATL